MLFRSVQFADYIYPGFNQLVSEISKSCYLSCGKFPVSTIIRVPIGAYGGGGPYHSGCVETTLLSIKGIKIAYPSNAADMKGLMKAAFLDPTSVFVGCRPPRGEYRIREIDEGFGEHTFSPILLVSTAPASAHPPAPSPGLPASCAAGTVRAYPSAHPASRPSRSPPDRR